MIVVRLGQRCIEVQTLGGSFAVFYWLLLPFILTRKQFPLKLSFAMTVNKSQGQTLGIVGLYLHTSAFTPRLHLLMVDSILQCHESLM